MKCEIRWIDLKTGKPTPDENEAVAFVRLLGYVQQFPGAVNDVIEHETTDWFPICAFHLERMREPGMEHWESKTLVTPEETELLVRVALAAQQTVDVITRRSPRPYDLHIEGLKEGRKYSAWLPLAAIGTLQGRAFAKAVDMSDYPEMAGDWSGIRDSSHETIWRIFEALCLK